MFALSVRNALDGSCRRLELTPETTIADIRARLEADLAFTEVHLLQGTRELPDGGVVEVELQAVASPSPEKALAELEMIHIARAASFLELTDDERQAVRAASKALGKMGELAPALCERLVHLLRSFQVDEVGKPLASIFGQVCGDPSPYVTEMVEMLAESGCFYYSCAAVAGVEIAARCGDSLPSTLRTALVEWATGETSSARRDSNLCMVSLLDMTCACQLLGLLGDDAHEESLQAIINFPLQQARCACGANVA